MTEYETELFEWKKKHGYFDPLDASEHGIQLMVEADRKLPGDAYCVLCGKGPQPISGMRVITIAEDAYMQMEPEEGQDINDPQLRMRACIPCFEERYPKEEEES